MEYLKSLKKRNYIKLPNNYNKSKTRKSKFKKNYFFIILLSFIAFAFIFLSYKLIKKIIQNNNKTSFNLSKDQLYYDLYEVNKYNEIKDKLLANECSQMWANHREFINGVIRKFKPKKILEIGVNKGGGSIVMLNAISDFKNSHLYSIDLNTEDIVGSCVREHFPELMKKWTLFKGNIATEFMEQIGNNIDMAFIDTAHYEPGEILDFIIALPFLKENAIVIIHDIANQLTPYCRRNEWAPYKIYNGIRGEKFLPSGPGILTKDIGGVKLDKNQKKYYYEYFRLLEGQWQYYPKKVHIEEMKKYFKKYYDDNCLTMFEEATSFNKHFVRRNRKEIIYKYNSD